MDDQGGDLPIPVSEWPPQELQLPADRAIHVNVSHNRGVDSKRKADERDEERDHKRNFSPSDNLALVHLVANNSLTANVALARWWKQQIVRGKFTEGNCPKHANATVLLNWIKTLDDAKSFLQRCITVLEERNDDPRIVTTNESLASMSSFYDVLREDNKALGTITEAIKLGEICNELLWTRERISRNVHIKSVQEGLVRDRLKMISSEFMMEPQEVECRCASDLTASDFYENYVCRKRPLIIKGLAHDLVKEPWDMNFIKKKLGSKSCTVKHRVATSTNWAKLEDRNEGCTVGEFIDVVSCNKDDTKSYLFDWSLPLNAPELLEDLKIPMYFCNDFLQRTEPGSLYKDSWPSLFVAPGGVVSDLHVDAFASNFWMALFTGRKKWTFFCEEDFYKLYPRYHDSLDAVFDVDLKQPDFSQHPLLMLARKRQCVLNAGDVLYVPSGSPHYVENLEHSVAISSNFVDNSNLDDALKELQLNALVNPLAKQLMEQFESETFCRTMLPIAKHAEWDGFKQQVFE